MKENWIILFENLKKYYNVCIDNIDYYYYGSITYSYLNKNRYYHNLNHIESLLTYSKDFELDIKDRILLELAIYFHDIIYDVKSGINELCSANYFKNFIEYGDIKISDEIKPVRDIILATMHNNLAKTRLEKIMCDIDLRELAEDWYIENSYKIKKEYQHLSNEEWKNGRINFINKFLSKDRIYLTDEYYNKYENKARINLTKEKEYLISDEYFRKIKNN